jgi:peptidoglycan/LPS O-acetylase OafA/YrhL
MPPPTAGSILPRLSTTVLLAMAAIAVIVMASIFGYILFVSGLRLDQQLWWSGLAAILFALGFFVLYAATHERRIVRPLAGAFFVISAGCFYGSIFAGGSDSLAKLLYLILLSILVVGALGAIFVMARDAEQDAIRKAQRRHIP